MWTIDAKADWNKDESVRSFVRSAGVRICLVSIAVSIALGGLLAIGSLMATTPSPSERGLAVYSTACETGGGDFAGFRVSLRTRGDATLVRIEFNDEGPDGRDTGKNVRFDPRSGRLSFKFQGSMGDVHSFVGLVTPTRLAARIDDLHAVLPRKLSHTAHLPEC
jgi:hypothetical protein